MNRFLRVMSALALVSATVYCSGDPTGDLRGGIDRVIASPQALFIGADSEQTVLVEALDEQGNRLAGDFTLIPDAGSIISVVEDSTFNLVYDAGGALHRPRPWTRARYIVHADANTGVDSFQVRAGSSKRVTVVVRVVPTALPTPKLGRVATTVGDTIRFGDTLTLTVPAPFRFTRGLQMFFDSAASSIPRPIPVAFSADSTLVKFIPTPGIGLDTVRVQGVVLNYAPTAVSFTRVSDSGFTSRSTAAANLPTLIVAQPAAAKIGDTITVDAPAPFLFSTSRAKPTTVTNIAGTLVSVSADQKRVKFLVGANVNGQVRITNLSIHGYLSLGAVTLTSGATNITSPPLPNLTFAPTTANFGDTITVTAPGPFRFTPGSRPTVAGAGLVFASISSDSLTLKFVIGPNANAAVSVNAMVLPSAPGLGTFTLTSGATTLNSPAVPNYTATFSSASPAIWDTVTVTLSAGFKFLPNAALFHGSATGAPAIIISRAPDSSAIRFVAAPGGASGPIFADNVVLAFLTAVPLNDLPSNTSLTPAAALSGTGSFATAPVLALPAAGSSVTYYDGGARNTVAQCTADNGAPCRVYQFTLAAGATVNFSARWGGTTDLGLYFYNNAGTLVNPFPTPCDGLGNGAGGQPEVCSQTLAAGTYRLTVVDFGPAYPVPEPAAAWYAITISR